MRGHFASTQHHHLPAQALGQLLRGLQAVTRGFVDAGGRCPHAPGSRADGGVGPRGWRGAPGARPGRRHPRLPASRPRRPRASLATLAIAVGQVGIDLRGGSLHGQFAQGGEVGLREKYASMAARACSGTYTLPSRRRPAVRAGGRSISTSSKASCSTQSGRVSRTCTPVMSRTLSLRLSRCWTLTVVYTSMPAASNSCTSCQRLAWRLPGALVWASSSTRPCWRDLEQAVEVHFFKRDATVLAAQQQVAAEASRRAALRFRRGRGFRPPRPVHCTLGVAGRGRPGAWRRSCRRRGRRRGRP